MQSESILAVIKRSGYAGRMTIHGFRSLFSTVLNESNLFNPDANERQLAHIPQNRIRTITTLRCVVFYAYKKFYG